MDLNIFPHEAKEFHRVNTNCLGIHLPGNGGSVLLYLNADEAHRLRQTLDLLFPPVPEKVPIRISNDLPATTH